MDNHAASCNLALRSLRSFWYWSLAAELMAAVLATVAFLTEGFFFRAFFFLLVAVSEAAPVAGVVGGGIVAMVVFFGKEKK